MELLKKIVYSLNLSLYVLIAFMVGIFLKQWLLGGIILLSSGVWANNGVLMTAALLVIIVVWSGNEQIAGLFTGE